MPNFRTTLAILLVAAASLGPLLAAEVGVRILIEIGRLPEAPARTEVVEVTVENLERLGAPDVLIVGTSVARDGIDPQTLQRLLARSDVEATVQSMAVAGVNLPDQHIIIRGLADRGLLPRVAVLGLSSVTLTADQGEPGWFSATALGRLWDGCQAGSEWDALVDCGLSQVSALWRWRGRLERIVEGVVRGTPRRLKVGTTILRPDGFLAVAPRRPKKLARLLPKTVERLLPGATLSAGVSADFATAVQLLRSEGVTVIPVFMPYSDELQAALLERNPEWVAQKQASVATLEEDADIEIIEVERFGDWLDADSLRDHRHLSRDGAPHFTRQLWDMPEFRARLLAGVE